MFKLKKNKEVKTKNKDFNQILLKVGIQEERNH